MKNLFVIFLLVLLLISCSNELASYEFESYKWKRNSKVEMVFSSENKVKEDLVLEMRSIYGFNHPDLSLDFVLLLPDGKILSFSKELSFDSEKMECTGDYCDQLITLLKDFQYTEGSYKLTVQPRRSSIDLYGFMEFRLIHK